MRTAYCFDLDGTITTTEILPCIASELGVSDEIATLTRLTMDGHVPFADSMRLRCLILGQVQLERIHEVISAIPLDAGLVDFISERSDQCFIVTGNLDIWIAPLVRRLNCGLFCSNATFADNRLRLTAILDKGEAVRRLRAEGHYDHFVAVGDGANDAPMLAESDLGIAYGGVHAPAAETITASHFIVNSSSALCNLLKAL
jgi:HAD superfamily phosphoserine phosphatase-like hydrolase